MSKKVATINDIKNQNQNGNPPGERQGFYVGGSQQSGQQVLGPPAFPNIAPDYREQLFNAARLAGAETMDPSTSASPNPEDAQFSGGGAKLGGPGASNSESVAAAAGVNASSGAELDSVSSENSDPRHPDVLMLGSEPRPTTIVHLEAYENGFILNGGPFRLYSENEEFMASVRRGQIPAELYSMYPRHNIDLRMQPKMGAYEAPKPENRPFMGAGARLGAIVPDVYAAAPLDTNKSVEDKAQLLKDAQSSVNLETGAPVTQIQIRLPNGERVIGRFNHNHTIQELRTFVVAAVPELAFGAFSFMQTFPNKQIEEEQMSLADAGLLNSVVIVKQA